MQKRESSKQAGKDIIEEMFKVGAHYGFKKSRRHPSTGSYVYATKNRTDIIDLEKATELLDQACDFVGELGKAHKSILFVGTKPEAQSAVKKIAESLSMPYVTERWIGGTLSNFSEIKKRIAELENYQKDVSTGSLEKYTKKEKLMLAKKMEKLARYYSGLLGLKKAPDALFIVDAREESIALTEATKSGIPVVALVNTDTNIKKVDYPIIGNDASIPSILFFVEEIEKAYKEGGLQK